MPDGGDVRKRKGVWSPLPDVIGTEWANLAGMWVPVQGTFFRPAGGFPKRIIEIEWHAVNGSIPPEQFQAMNLPLPEDVTIGGSRLDPDRPIVGKKPGARPISEVLEVSKTNDFHLWLLAAINAAALALVAGYLGARRILCRLKKCG